MQPMGAKQRGWPTSTSPRSPPIAPQPTDELPATRIAFITVDPEAVLLFRLTKKGDEEEGEKEI